MVTVWASGRHETAKYIICFGRPQRWLFIRTFYQSRLALTELSSAQSHAGDRSVRINLRTSQSSRMEGPPSAARHTDENAVHTSLKPSTASAAPSTRTHNPFAAVKQQQQMSDENEIEHCPPGDPAPADATPHDAGLDVYSSDSYVNSTAAFVRAEDMASELQLPPVPPKPTQWAHGQGKIATFSYLSKLPAVPGTVDRKGSLASSGRGSFAEESTTDELLGRAERRSGDGVHAGSAGAQGSASRQGPLGAEPSIDMGFS